MGDKRDNSLIFRAQFVSPLTNRSINKLAENTLPSIETGVNLYCQTLLETYFTRTITPVVTLKKASSPFWHDLWQYLALARYRTNFVGSSERNSKDAIIENTSTLY